MENYHKTESFASLHSNKEKLGEGGANKWWLLLFVLIIANGKVYIHLQIYISEALLLQ